MALTAKSIGILWRGDRAEPIEASRTYIRLRPVFDALQAASIGAEAVVFDDDIADDVRTQLRQLDGVLVWVDPVMGDRDRTVLDALLRDVAASGTWVSSHPDVILKMGTKEILVSTRDLPFGSDCQVYRTGHEFRREFPRRLQSGSRVLKRHRGNAGIGVWKVELDADVSGRVEVQDAHPRGTDVETMPLGDFLRQHETYLTGDACLVDQPFQPRIVDGMVRCYIVRDKVAGFARQAPDAGQLASGRVFGLPSGKIMFDADEPAFARLRRNMESEWIPALQRVTGVETGALPMLWDADFFYGPKDAAGGDTYILCEINVSSIIPFPDTVPANLATAVADRMASR